MKVADFVDHLDRTSLENAAFEYHMGKRIWDVDMVKVHPHLEDALGDALFDLLDDYNSTLPKDKQLLNSEDWIETHEFEAFVKRWTKARFDHVIAGLLDLDDGTGAIELRRHVVIPNDLLDKWENVTAPASQYGLCWSAKDGEAAAYLHKGMRGDLKDIEVCLHAKVPLDTIDWEKTVLSRMDYMNGDHEGEIRLRADAPLRVTSVEHIRPKTPERSNENNHTFPAAPSL